MFRKHHRLILVPVVLLVVVGSMLFLGNGLYGAYTVCRNELPSGDGWKYLRTGFYTDGVNDIWCKMYRRGSEWVVISKATTIVGMCP